MNQFQTVALFTYPTDLFVAKSFLESNDIECFVQDELTIQVHNFYSNAIGGIKLQVKYQDFKKARNLLSQNGFIKEEDVVQNEFLPKLDKLTSKLPIIGTLSFPKKMISIFVFLLLIIIIPSYFYLIPTTNERLTNSSWCLSHVSFNGKNYMPSSNQIRIVFPGDCEESIDFKVNGILILPGFESKLVRSQWILEGNKVQILGSNNFANVYDGIYDLNFDGRELIIKSDNTILYCYQ